ncbi:MAG: alpha/beta hydrolase [Syntrophobacteraceae bacterium]
MDGISHFDYSVLDKPEILNFLFHPRPEWAGSISGGTGKDMMIPVAENVSIGARFYMADKRAPNILFFHGNGEIVSDYEDLGPVYTRMGINFLPVDYRGYGRSNGKPTVSSMLADSHKILDFVADWLLKNEYTGPLIVMGRSLGSASAIELAANYHDRIRGLVVESGFAYLEPLLKLLGIDTARLGFKEEEGSRNIDKIALFEGPTLIIHAEYDQIIPFADGQSLYQNSRSKEKVLVKIPNAGHNDIFYNGMSMYMAAIKTFTDKIK